VPDYGTEEVANHAHALCFAVYRRVLEYDRSVREGRWGYQVSCPIHQLSTLCAGVLGLGRIGSAFADGMKPFVREVVAFALMKRKPILINVSRGGLIDSGALVRALRTGQISGAGLDVFEDEPQVPADFLGLENVVLSPHLAWYSEEGNVQLRRSSVEEIVRVLTGKNPKNPVV
jgi:D-3-phosphoglycerate dehydrogenase / 2-oxoglutarate reductase